MPQQNNSIENLRNPIFIGTVALYLAAIHFSPSIASIASVLMILNAFWHFITQSNNKYLLYSQTLFIGVFFVSIAISIMWGCNLMQLMPKVLVRLPLVFIPSLLSFVHVRKVNFVKYWFLFALPIFWLSIASVINYVQHYKFLSQMVLESKPVPVFTRVYHIEFSVIISFVLLVLIAWKLEGNELLLLSNKYWFYIISGGLFIALHVLSARTGLLGFWSGMFYIGWLHRKLLKIKFVLIGIVIVASFILIPSVKNRLLNTIEDATAVIKNQDLNHKSFGQRWEAWKAIVHAGKKSIWFGVGQCNIETAMQQSFDELKSDLDAENRISPHNQYLQWFIEIGLVGMCLWILAWIFLMFTCRKWALSKYIMAIIIAMILSMNFESLMERQAGILAIVVSLCLISRNKSISNPNKMV